MKQIIKIIFLLILVCSCSNSDKPLSKDKKIYETYLIIDNNFKLSSNYLKTKNDSLIRIYKFNDLLFKSDSLCDYINEIKSILKSRFLYDYKNELQFNGINDSIYKKTFFLFWDRNNIGAVLRIKLYNYRKYIILISKNDNEFKGLANGLLSTLDPPPTPDSAIPWETYMFGNKPILPILTNLSMLENNVRLIEYEVILNLIKNTR